MTSQTIDKINILKADARGRVRFGYDSYRIEVRRVAGEVKVRVYDRLFKTENILTPEIAPTALFDLLTTPDVVAILNQAFELV